jgi:hypothetical protein
MLTLDQARAVVWPFAQPKRPIGDLLDEGRIGEPDLRRALRVAYSRRVKSACTIVLQALLKPDRPVTVGPRLVSLLAIPATCPICGARTQPDHRWDSASHGVGWRCETDGATHCLQLWYLAKLKAVYGPEAYVVPPRGEDPGVRRCDLARGPIGYLPETNQ